MSQRKKKNPRNAAQKSLYNIKLIFKSTILMQTFYTVHFSEIGKVEARTEVVYKSCVVEAVRVAKEEASKFCHEEAWKAGAAAARKLLAAEGKKLANEGGEIGEVEGGKAGEKAGADEGEAAGGSEAERLGAEEGERVGREIAGEEGDCLCLLAAVISQKMA